MVKAVVFDVDGTLVKSEPLSMKSICVIYKRMFNVEFPISDIFPYCGCSDEMILSDFNKRFGIDYDIHEISRLRQEVYNELASKDLKCMEGARDFILSCQQAGLRTAVATGAPLKHLEVNLSALKMNISDFEVVLTGDEVPHAKPHPDIYIKSAQLLGAKPEECLVFEDSTNGHKSARAAGIPSIGILGSFTAQEQADAGAMHVMQNFLDFPDFKDINEFNNILSSLCSGK